MNLHRLLSSRSITAKKSLLNSANAARPALFEPLEDRQMLSLTIDVRTPSGGSSATANSVGQVINLDVLAVVSGTKPASIYDGLDIVTGSFLGTASNQIDSVAGDLSATVAGEFTANSAFNGTQTDLNNDGNLDVGSNNNSNAAGFFSARAGGIAQDGTVSGNTETFLIGTLTYTVTSLNFGSETDISFRPRYGLSSGAYDAVWYEDGSGQNDATGTFQGGSPFVITDPNLTAPTGSISGTISKSSGGSTTPDAGVQVYLDSNNNGVLNAGEYTTTTASDGSYSFSGLPAGTYDVRQVVPSGFTQTSPGSSPTVVNLSDGQTVTGKNFTDSVQANASISGTVSKVIGGNTSADAGVTVFLDTNNNGVLDSGETSTTTAANGTYSFTGLVAKSYNVRQVVPSGYTQTSPSTSPTVVTLTAGQVSTGDDFTDTAVANASISGTVSKIANGSNSAQSGVTVYLDTNDNGSLDNGEPSTTTASNGSFSFTGLVATTYFLREIVPTGFTQTSPGSSPTSITLSAGQTATGENFTNTANPPLNNASISGTISQVVNGTTSPDAGVTVYLDTNNNGALDAGEPQTTTAGDGSYSFTGLAANTYRIREVVPSGFTQTTPSTSPTTVTLTNGQAATNENFTDTANQVTASGSISGTVSKVVSGSTSAFSGVTLYLDSNDNGILDAGEPTATTNASGAYSFTGLSPTTYYLREIVPSGFTQTTPGGSPTIITVGNSAVTGENFVDTAIVTQGNPLTGTVIGTSGSYKNDGNTIANAFDGNLSTFYDGASANGNWAGLNLGKEFTITQISYSPRTSWAARMVGGVFQGSNDPTFNTGVATLATVTTTPATGVYTTVSVSDTAPFEYVRYLSPNGSYGDVAEIKFFGTAVTTTNNLLSGSVIGTAGSWKNNGTVINNAFDGNINTYFDGPVSNGDWAGLDLGTTYNITQISYAPRTSWASRMVGGIFQASSSPTFASGVVNLYTITSTPAYNVFTTVNVNSVGAYRYVRYLGPAGSYGDVAEVEFFGTASTSTHTPLNGTVIGTSGSFGNSGNTIAKAFDGNLSTFFDGPTANGNYAGLDLGTAQSVTQISYAPRSGWASRMVGGLFQASNTANFSSGVVTLYTITSTPVTGSLTTVAVSAPGTFRYVRYLSPAGSYGDVSEIVFYS